MIPMNSSNLTHSVTQPVQPSNGTVLYVAQQPQQVCQMVQMCPAPQPMMMGIASARPMTIVTPAPTQYVMQPLQQFIPLVSQPAATFLQYQPQVMNQVPMAVYPANYSTTSFQQIPQSQNSMVRDPTPTNRDQGSTSTSATSQQQSLLQSFQAMSVSEIARPPSSPVSQQQNKTVKDYGKPGQRYRFAPTSSSTPIPKINAAGRYHSKSTLTCRSSPPASPRSTATSSRFVPLTTSTPLSKTPNRGNKSARRQQSVHESFVTPTRSRRENRPPNRYTSFNALARESPPASPRTLQELDSSSGQGPSRRRERIISRRSGFDLDFFQGVFSGTSPQIDPAAKRQSSFSSSTLHENSHRQKKRSDKKKD